MSCFKCLIPKRKNCVQSTHVPESGIRNPDPTSMSDLDEGWGCDFYTTTENIYENIEDPENSEPAKDPEAHYMTPYYNRRDGPLVASYSIPFKTGKSSQHCYDYIRDSKVAIVAEPPALPPRHRYGNEGKRSFVCKTDLDSVRIEAMTIPVNRIESSMLRSASAVASATSSVASDISCSVVGSTSSVVIGTDIAPDIPIAASDTTVADSETVEVQAGAEIVEDVVASAVSLVARSEVYSDAGSTSRVVKGTNSAPDILIAASDTTAAVAETVEVEAETEIVEDVDDSKDDSDGNVDGIAIAMEDSSTSMTIADSDDVSSVVSDIDDGIEEEEKGVPQHQDHMQHHQQMQKQQHQTQDQQQQFVEQQQLQQETEFDQSCDTANHDKHYNLKNRLPQQKVETQHQATQVSIGTIEPIDNSDEAPDEPSRRDINFDFVKSLKDKSEQFEADYSFYKNTQSRLMDLAAQRMRFNSYSIN